MTVLHRPLARDPLAGGAGQPMPQTMPMRPVIPAEFSREMIMFSRIMIMSPEFPHSNE